MSLVACLFVAQDQQLWFDESYSITVARHDMGQMISLVAVDVHPPFYYIILKVWGGLFGFEAMTLRVLSALFYSAAIGLMLLLISKLFNKRVAVMGFPILLLAPFLLRYGFEIRMYSLASLIAVVSTWVMYHAYKTNKNWQWAVYAVTVALGMYTLYTMAVVFVAQLIWLAVMTRKKKKNILKEKWILAYAGAVLLFVPWLPIAIRQMRDSGLPGVATTFGAEQLSEVLTYNILYKPASQMRILDWVLIIMVVGAAAWAIIALRKNRAFNKRGLGVIAGLFGLSVAVWAVTASPLLDSNIYLERYTAQFVIFGYASLAVVLASYVETKGGRGGSLTAYMIVAFVMLIGINNLIYYGNFNFQRWERPNTRDVMDVAIEFCYETVVVDDPFVFIELDVYTPEGCNFKFFGKEEFRYHGGYAPLHLIDERRIANVVELTTDTVVMVSLTEEPNLDITEYYELVETIGMEKRNLLVYERR